MFQKHKNKERERERKKEQSVGTDINVPPLSQCTYIYNEIFLTITFLFTPKYLWTNNREHDK